MALGDRVVVMRKGEIQQCGAPLDVYRRPANRFVAGFVGAPSMNFLEGRLAGGRGVARFRCGLGDWELPPEVGASLGDWQDEPAVLGIRPEHVHLSESRESGSSPTARMEVRVVEHVGDSTLVHLRTSSEIAIIARVPGVSDIRVGECAEISPRLADAHFFEVGTAGCRLY